MKLFSSLPKKDYQTSIGTKKLSNFYSFYKKNLQNKQTSNVKFDKQTTLIEASIQVFDDPDSLWVFLHSNNKINPFKLLADNSTTFIIQNEINTSFNPLTSNTGYYDSGVTFTVPIGTILTTYSGVTGASWSYSSVGNFDLNGPFTIVEKSNSYNLSVTVKPRKNLSNQTDIIIPGTDGSSETEQFVFITKGTTYSALNNTFYNVNTIKYTKGVYSQENSSKTSEIFIPEGGPEPSETDPVFFAGGGGTVTTKTIEENAIQKIKNINVIVPSSVSSSMSSFITPKYKA